MISQNNTSWYFLYIFSLLISLDLCAVRTVNQTVATISVGLSPSGIALTPDGLFAYVANNDNADVAGGNTVSVINTQTNKVVQTISDASFDNPYTVTINASGSYAYVTNANSTTVSVISTASNTVVDVITGFDGPSDVVITPDGKTAYVNNYGSAFGVGSGNGTTVRVVNLTTNTIVGPAITVGMAPAGLAMDPSGAFVYSVNYVDGNPGTGTMSVIQTSTNTVVRTMGGFFGPFDIVVSADGLFAYVTNFGSNNFDPVGTTVTVVDLKKSVIVATISVGIQPSGIALSPDGRFAFVTNYNTLYLGPSFTDLTAGQGTVSVIDIATNTVLLTFLTGSSPDAIAISPDGLLAYVTNYSSDNVTVISIYDAMWLNVCKK